MKTARELSLQRASQLSTLDCIISIHLCDTDLKCVDQATLFKVKLPEL